MLSSLIAAQRLGHTGRHVEIRRVPEPADLHPIERRNFIGNSRLFQRADRLAAALRSHQAVSAIILTARSAASDRGARGNEQSNVWRPPIQHDVGDVRLIELPRYAPRRRRDRGGAKLRRKCRLRSRECSRSRRRSARGAANTRTGAVRKFMLCVHGAVDVVCDDGREQRTFHARSQQPALLRAADDLEHRRLSR